MAAAIAAAALVALCSPAKRELSRAQRSPERRSTIASSVTSRCPARSERDDAPVTAPRLPLAHRVPDGDDGKVFGGLPGESVPLRVRVGVDPVVAIEMVVRHVEEDRDPRAKCVHALHLEARDLEDDGVPGLVRVRRERFAEIPADEGAERHDLQDGADDRRRGALSVRPADGHDRRFVRQRADRELDLADDRGPSRRSAACELGKRRHAR